MDRVGGYLDYLALRENAAAFDDVVLVLAAEAQAADDARREARLKSEGAR